MIELHHHLAEPTELREYRNLHGGESWGDQAFIPIRTAVRRQLNLEQEGLCVYCESALDKDNGHVEHIQAKGKGGNPALTFVYENLAHSCSSSDHCGHHKLKQILPVEPRQGCNRFFALSALDGRLAPALGLNGGEGQQAIESIRVLGLNHPSLAWQRKGLADAIIFLRDNAEREAFLIGLPFRWSLRSL